MSDFSEIVDSLENRISKLLHKMELLKQQNQELSEELTVCKHKNDQLHKQVANWEGRYNALKLTNSMLGSNDNKTEANLKINTLIREIDACIAQLSD